MRTLQPDQTKGESEMERLQQCVRKAQKGIRKRKSSASADCSDLKPFDAQFRLRYIEGGGPPAENVKYKLVETKTQKILKEGTTNEDGLTEQIFTDNPEEVNVIVIRKNDDRLDEEKNVGTFKTNDKKDSCEDVFILRGRIFFDFRYVNSVRDKAQSFIKAAETRKRKTMASSVFDKRKGDVWWSFIITTECEMKTQWQTLFDLQQETEMLVEQGHLFTHASKDTTNPENKSGLLFAGHTGCSEDAIPHFCQPGSAFPMVPTKQRMQKF
jgi:hypothetical protein